MAARQSKSAIFCSLLGYSRGPGIVGSLGSRLIRGSKFMRLKMWTLHKHCLTVEVARGTSQDSTLNQYQQSQHLLYNTRSDECTASSDEAQELYWLYWTIWCNFDIFRGSLIHVLITDYAPLFLSLTCISMWNFLLPNFHNGWFIFVYGQKITNSGADNPLPVNFLLPNFHNVWFIFVYGQKITNSEVDNPLLVIIFVSNSNLNCIL